jgi:hypothetical protein
VNPSDRFEVKTANIVHETIEGETVIVNLENGYYYSTDKLGSVFWNLLQSGLAYQEIIELLVEHYPQDLDEIRNSFAGLIEELQAEGLIAKTGGETSAATPNQVLGALGDLEFSAPVLQKHEDMEELLLVDPIHDVEESGWPNKK